MQQLAMTLTGPVRKHNLESRGWQPGGSQACMIELATGERIDAVVTYRGTIKDICGGILHDSTVNGHVLYITGSINGGQQRWMDVCLELAPSIVCQDWLASVIADEVLEFFETKKVVKPAAPDPNFWEEFRAMFTCEAST